MRSLRWRFVLLLVLFAVVVLAVWYRHRAPVPAGDDVPQARVVALAPFRWTEGEDRQAMRMAVPRLLAARLAGNGGWRRIAPEVVAARLAAEGAAEDDEALLSVARALHAQALVVGQLRASGDAIEVRAVWRSVDEAAALAPASQPVEVRGSRTRLAELVDRLADGLLQGRVAAEDLRIAQVAAVTSWDHRALLAFLAGEEHFSRGEYDAAERAWQAAVEVDPQFALAYLRLARLHQWRGKLGAAAQSRQYALLLSNRLPASEREWLDLELLALRGDWQEAQHRYRSLLVQSPSDWEGWCGLAELYRLQGEDAAAREALRQAGVLLPQHVALTTGRLASERGAGSEVQ